MSFSISDKRLSKLFHVSVKYVEPRFFPRLRKILTREGETALSKYYSSLEIILPRNEEDAKALIIEINLAPLLTQARAIHIKKEALRMISGTKPTIN